MQPMANEKAESVWIAQEQESSAKLSKKNQHLKENIVIIIIIIIGFLNIKEGRENFFLVDKECVILIVLVHSLNNNISLLIIENVTSHVPKR